eukprot:GHVN01085458.1.p1 GENE.GHVN01085458.1~~GHVN01085458.1.p1  ORF type:complete len:112 (+),score=31.67 GHVN01085458.1:268-603(+)
MLIHLQPCSPTSHLAHSPLSMLTHGTHRACLRSVSELTQQLFPTGSFTWVLHCSPINTSHHVLLVFTSLTTTATGTSFQVDMGFIIRIRTGTTSVSVASYLYGSHHLHHLI